MTARDPVLTVEDLSVNFAGPRRRSGIPAVDNVSFEVARGEVFSLIGESGSGKSTILLALAGLLPGNALVGGRATLKGKDELSLIGGETNASERRRAISRRVGVVFQNPSATLNPVLSVGDQLREVVAAHTAGSREEIAARSRELLEAVGLSDEDMAERYLRAFPHQLSGGQKQRVALAAALASEPALLLADEPTTALDTTVQAQILDLLLKLVDDRNLALVFVTHDLALAASISDRVAILKDGRLMETGPAVPVLHSPTTIYGRDLAHAALRFTREAEPIVRDHDGGTSKPMLSLREVSKSFRTNAGRIVALSRVNLAVPAGRIVGLIGESGSGKTTLARIAAGLVTPDGGTVQIGEDAAQRGARRTRGAVQMVFQDPLGSFNPRYSIGAAIGHPLRCLLAVPARERADRVSALMDDVGLAPLLKSRLPSDLSGGELQRAAIARALAPSPAVLICDEAVASLDASVRAQILDLLRALVEREDLGILFISHDIALVREIADETVVLAAGTVVEEGETSALLDNPREAYTRELIAAVPPSDVPWRTARATRLYGIAMGRESALIQ